jgi:hypothetical protein
MAEQAKKLSFTKTIVFASIKWCEKGWKFNKKVIKTLLLSIDRRITGERPVFTEEMVLTDPEDWGASMSAERSGRSIKELNSKELKVTGTPACTCECKYYISFRGQKRELSAAEFYKLIPKR